VTVLSYGTTKLIVVVNVVVISHFVHTVKLCCYKSLINYMFSSIYYITRYTTTELPRNLSKIPQRLKS